MYSRFFYCEMKRYAVGSILALTLASMQACAERTDAAPADPPTPPITKAVYVEPERESNNVAPEPARTAKASRAAATTSGVRFKIVTGGERETNFQIGRDLAKFVAPAAGVRLDVMTSKGSTENMYRLHDEPGVELAIVQYDVFQAFLNEAAAGNKKAARVVRPMRVVMPLYTEEIYFIARSNSPLTSIDEIKGKKINIGLIGSGSALSVAALYQRMFGGPIPTANVSYLSDENALIALTVAKTVDVVVVVAGQPTKLMADMKPQAREIIKLLKLEPDRPAAQAALKTYFPATIRTANYPAWLGQDVPTLSVMSFLITSNGKDKAAASRMGAFARSICQNIGVLRKQGHPKWREVEIGQKLGNNWSYSSSTEAAFDNCPARDAIAGIR